MSGRSMFKTIRGRFFTTSGSLLISNVRKPINVVNKPEDFDLLTHWYIIELLGDYPNFILAKIIDIF